MDPECPNSNKSLQKRCRDQGGPKWVSSKEIRRHPGRILDNPQAWHPVAVRSHGQRHYWSLQKSVRMETTSFSTPSPKMTAYLVYMIHAASGNVASCKQRSKNTSVHVYVCMYVCMHACRYVGMYEGMHACMHACMYVIVYAKPEEQQCNKRICAHMQPGSL